jgi:hypothetical protein
LETLDYFYRKQLQKPFLKPTSDENTDQFLDRVVDTHVVPENRIFARRLKIALELVKTHYHEKADAIPFINDAGQDSNPILQYFLNERPECTIVQMAQRLPSRGNSFSALEIDIDQDYYSRLLTLNPGVDGVLQQALLK